MEIEKIKKLWIDNTIEETQPGEHYRYMKPDEFIDAINQAELMWLTELNSKLVDMFRKRAHVDQSNFMVGYWREVQDKIKQLENKMGNKFYIKRINVLHPDVIYILNKNNEFVILTEDVLDLISFNNHKDVETYITNNIKLFADITINTMMNTRDYGMSEFMNKLNYEVGFVAEQYMTGIEGLTSTYLKEQVKQFLFNEKEKQKQNVTNLINEKNALQNEVNKLKEIF